MNIKYLVVLFLSSTLILVTGCSRQTFVYNVPTQDVTTNKKQASVEEVKKAIITAGASLGWIMHTTSPNHLTATLHVRTHMAKVDIHFNAKSYSIKYIDSTNLKYEPAGTETIDEDGVSSSNNKAIIHKNYNSWVTNLDRAIKAQFSTIY